MSSITVEWWESVCIELTRNPIAATKTITDFRDSDQALEASKYFLQPTTGCSAIAQFQAALILQHVCLKHWNKLSSNETQELRNTLWTLLHSSLTAGTMPSFALNKIMQVYALLWKRGWNDIDETNRQQLFQQIQAFMNNQEYMKIGAILLRTVFEEFCRRSSAEIGLPLEFHRIAHTAFSQSGLDQGLDIGIKCLLQSFNILLNINDNINIVTIATATSTLGECSKLIVEIINWDFGDTEKFSFGLNTETEREKQRTNDLLNLPRKWSSIFLNENFINELFISYQHVKLMLLHYNRMKVQTNNFVRSTEGDIILVLESTLNELRLLITALASITGTFFTEDSEKSLMCGFLLSKLSPCFLNSLMISQSVYGDELRSVECVHFGTVFLRLLGNFRLSVVCCIPHDLFEQLIITLGTVTFIISEELLFYSEKQLKSIYRYSNDEILNYSDNILLIKDTNTNLNLKIEENECSLLEGWRGEVLSSVLDTWCMIIDDPLLILFNIDNIDNNGVNNQNNGNNMNNSIINNGINNNNNNTNIIPNSILHSITNKLHEVSRNIFHLLFDCMMRDTVYQALVGAEEEEEEEYSSSSGNILRSVCTLGRTNFKNSLQTIHRLHKRPANFIYFMFFSIFIHVFVVFFYAYFFYCFFMHSIIFKFSIFQISKFQVF